ncbi:hypothetical protein [Extibacter muris]|uniref:hypothetical protein n=1 Tax=Extibacter muris TaxID=1796622 RepID=UPI00142DCA63|nr:hypothetical protein [Extibacter muris]
MGGKIAEMYLHIYGTNIALSFLDRCINEEDMLFFIHGVIVYRVVASQLAEEGRWCK